MSSNCHNAENDLEGMLLRMFVNYPELSQEKLKLTLFGATRALDHCGIRSFNFGWSRKE